MNNKLVKKASIFTVSLFTIVSLMAFSPGNKSYAASNTDSTNQIKNVISNYFNSEFESIKKGQAVNEDSIIGNGKLKEFINLRNTRKGIWYKKLNYNLVNYSININYNSIIFNGDICTVDLSKDNQFSFDQDPNIVSKESGEKHIITLKTTGNKWLIDNDVDINKIEDNKSNSSSNSLNKLIKASAVSDTNTYLDKEISNLREKANNIDTEINEYKQFKKNVNQSRKKKAANNSLLSIMPSNSFEGRTWQVDYNYKAAVAYANMWANSYNNYDYCTLSNDCANFVSQSIYAGAPVMNTGTVGWFGGTLMNGPAWVLVSNQWDFLVTNTGKGPVAIDNTHRYDICDGDPIHLWSAYSNEYNHAIIVTAIGETGDLYINGHTNARKEYPLASLYETGNYNQSKQRTAHILGYNK